MPAALSRTAISTLFQFNEIEDNELSAFNGDNVDIGFIEEKQSYIKLRVGELIRDRPCYSGLTSTASRQRRLPPLHPTPVELAFDLVRDTVVLWVGIAKPGMSSLKRSHEPQMNPVDVLGENPVRVVVPYGDRPEYFALVEWDETTGLCKGIPIDTCHVFFFSEFRDGNTPTYDQNRLKWEAKVREEISQKPPANRYKTKELSDVLSGIDDDTCAATLAFRRAGSGQSLEACVQLVENAVHIVSHVDTDTSALSAFLSAASVVAEPVVVEEAVREIESKWPETAHILTTDDLYRMYHSIRAANVSIPYETATDFMMKWQFAWAARGQPILSEANMGVISAQIFSSVEKFDTAAVRIGQKNLKSSIKALASLIEDLEVAIKQADVILSNITEMTTHCQVTMTIYQIKDKIEHDSDPGLLAAMTANLWLNRLNVAVASLTTQRDLCEKKLLCRQHILHREETMLQGLLAAQASNA